MKIVTSYCLDDGVKVDCARVWTGGHVKELCIEGDLYTMGNNYDFEAMLDFVDNNEPNVENMLTVARDIQKHSHHQYHDLDFYMWLLEHSAIIKIYRVTETS